MDAPRKDPEKPSGKERRQSFRAQIKQAVRIRSDGPESLEETCKTRDVSRSGFFFTTNSSRYYLGMHLYAVLGYQPGDPVTKEWLVEVVRIEKLPAGDFGIAVRILMR